MHTLDDLPDALQLHIADSLLASNQLQSLSSLSSTSRALSRHLQPAMSKARGRRLRWHHKLTHGHKISEDGLRITMVGVPNGDSWAAGPELPTTGRSHWTIVKGVIALGKAMVGVCSGEAPCRAWALHLKDGLLCRLVRKDRSIAKTTCAPMAPGYSASFLWEVRCTWDADVHCLTLCCVSLTGDQTTSVLDMSNELTRSEKCRPFARLYARRGDNLTFKTRGHHGPAWLQVS